MLARLQQLLVVAMLAGSGIVFALLWPRLGWLALGVAVLVLVSHSILLAFQFLRMQWPNKDEATLPPTRRALLKAWYVETFAAAKVFFWWQPFFSRAYPDRLRDPEDRGRRGIVFVHGFLCNRAVWTPWYPLLARHGIPFVAVSMEPVFGSIDAYRQRIDDAVAHMTAITGQCPILVCHSMGGLAARAWLRDKDPLVQRVLRVVTLGSPHHGTRVVPYLPTMLRILNGEQMRHGSEWLRQLGEKESAAMRRHFTCYYSNCDNIVVPATTATLEDADNRFVPGVPHVSLAFDGRVIDDVLKMALADGSVYAGATRCPDTNDIRPAEWVEHPTTFR